MNNNVRMVFSQSRMSWVVEQWRTLICLMIQMIEWRVEINRNDSKS